MTNKTLKEINEFLNFMDSHSSVITAAKMRKIYPSSQKRKAALQLLAIYCYEHCPPGTNVSLNWRVVTYDLDTLAKALPADFKPWPPAKRKRFLKILAETHRIIPSHARNTAGYFIVNPTPLTEEDLNIKPEPKFTASDAIVVIQKRVKELETQNASLTQELEALRVEYEDYKQRVGYIPNSTWS